MKVKTMKRLMVSLFSAAALLLAELALTGCGGGSGGGDASASGSTNTNQGGGDLAPGSIGGKTFHGHINGLTVNWSIVFSGTGNSGTYTHTEPPYQSETGTYTYTKTGSNTGVINLSFGAGTTLELTYTGVNSGTYLIPKSSESGTFTSN